MKNLFRITLLLLIVSPVIAQESDSISTDSSDQILKDLTEQLELYEQLITQNDKKRRQDSLARVDLMKQMQLLRETDKVQMSSLRAQIIEIEKRDSLRESEQRGKMLELRSTTKGFPVAPFRDTLFFVYTKLGAIQAVERAEDVTEKVEELVQIDVFIKDSLILQDHATTIDIVYGNVIIASITDLDALWADRNSKVELANTYIEIIHEYVELRHDRSSIQNILARIGLVFLILGTALLVMYFLSKLANGIQGWMVVNKKKYFTGIRIGNYEFLPPSRQLDVSIRIVGILKWGFYVLVFYLSLPIIFGIFPFTKGWAQTLLDWILSPIQNIWSSFWEYLPNFFTIAIIFIITRYLVRFLRFISNEIELGNLKLIGFHSELAVPTFRLARILIYAFMLVVVYPYLPGSDSDVFKGVSIFIGFLIALGSISTVSNAIAGLVTTYIRPFRKGDWVKIGETTGEIMEKKMLVTRIRTHKNENITVPNSTMLSGPTVNYTTSSEMHGLILQTTISIGYKVPWEKVHELLIEAAVETDGVNVIRDPFVLQTSLDEGAVAYQLNAYMDVPEKMAIIRSDLHANIQNKFKDAGIDLSP